MAFQITLFLAQDLASSGLLRGDVWDWEWPFLQAMLCSVSESHLFHMAQGFRRLTLLILADEIKSKPSANQACDCKVTWHL